MERNIFNQSKIHVYVVSKKGTSDPVMITFTFWCSFSGSFQFFLDVFCILKTLLLFVSPSPVHCAASDRETFP